MLAPFPVGFRPYRVTCGDLDGDGRAEILVSAQNSHHVELWLTRAGDPLRFERTADLGLHGGCLDVLLADLDNDGRPEVISAWSRFADAQTQVAPLRGLVRARSSRAVRTPALQRASLRNIFTSPSAMRREPNAEFLSGRSFV